MAPLDRKHKEMSAMLADLTLFDPIIMQTVPSLLAAGIYCLSQMYVKHKLSWSEELVKASGGNYSQEQVMLVAAEIHDFAQNINVKYSSVLMEKYSRSFYSAGLITQF